MKIFISTTILLNCLLVLTAQQNISSCPQNGVCKALWDTTGDVTIGIVANFHTGAVGTTEFKPCSVFVSQDVELVEMVRWLFDKMYDANYIPGIRLGVEVYDACDRSDIAITSAVSMLPYLRYTNVTKPKHVDGILGILTSSQAQHLVDTLEDTNVPLVSPTATAPSLSNYSRFFRTIPNDELQMKVLYNFIKSLQMKYIAIVYSDDQFGHQGVKEIEKLVKDDGAKVCIADSIVTKNFHDTIRIVDSLAILQENLNQKNLPVLFIGQYIDAQGLVRAANTNEMARHLIWVFPDAVGVDASLFDGYEKVGRNSFSVSPNYNDIQEFKTYWTAELYRTVISGAPVSTYPSYYREYVESKLDCSVSSGTCNGKTIQDLNNAYPQSSYISTVFHSAFVLAKAVKILHEDACGLADEYCSNLQQMLQSTQDSQFIKILKSISVDYTGEDNLPFLPVSMQGSTTFSFGNDGNLDVGTNQSIYLIHNAKCRTNCIFQKVGNATTDHIELTFEDITVYLDQNSNLPIRGSQLPSIYCVKNCQACEDRFKPNIQHASIWGENLIVSFVPVHKLGKTAFSCGDMRERQTIEDVEALLYGIETFNNNTGPWHGRPVLAGHLGIIVFDSCQNPLLSASILSQWLGGTLKIYDRQGRYFDPKSCIGIIGGLYSQTNLQIIHISRREFLVQVGYASSSLELPLNSPEFLRTIPADDIQVQAMIALLKQQGFSAFSVLYTDDSYGHNGYRQLVIKAEEAKLCINKAITIPRNIKEQDLADVFAALQDAEETKVVVVFSGGDEGDIILKTANMRTIRKKFIWIGSESWGKRNSLIDAESGIEALGLIVIDFLQSTDLNYTTYMTKLRPNQNTRNMFFKEWWENEFQCQLATSAIPNPPNKCGDTLTIAPPSDIQTAILALKSVWTMALGLSSAFSEICQREPLRCSSVIRNENARNLIYEEIRSVKLLENGEEYNVYSSRGDGSLTEELWNVHNINDQRKYVKVAEYSGSGLVLSNSSHIKFYDVNGQEAGKLKSTCYECDCMYRFPDDPLIQLNNNITINGHLYITAFLPFHWSRHRPEIDASTVALSEALIRKVSRVNREIFGKNILGLLVYDSYGDKDIAALQTMLALEAGPYLRLDNYNTAQHETVCIFTYGTGIDVAYISNALNKEVIHINVGETIISATPRKYFYNHGFTLKQELQAIVDIIKYYDWTYFNVVYGRREEGIYAKNTFMELTESVGLCTIETFSLDSFISATQNDRLIRPVTVIFIDDQEVFELLNKIGSRLGNKQFIAWSKLTKVLSYIPGNSYKSVLNNTIGVSIGTETVSTNMLQSVMAQSSDENINPWLEGNLDVFNEAFDNSKANIMQMEYAIESFANALNSLMLAECEGIGDLCNDLLDKPDWNTERLSLFLEREDDFSHEAGLLKKFNIKSFQMKSSSSGEFIGKHVGLYYLESTSVRIKNAALNSIYENITSKCEGENCGSCNAGLVTRPFPGWAIFLIITIVLLVILAIALVAYILHLHRKQAANQRLAAANSISQLHPPSPPADQAESVYMEPYAYDYQKNGYLHTNDSFQYDYAIRSVDDESDYSYSTDRPLSPDQVKRYNVVPSTQNGGGTEPQETMRTESNAIFGVEVADSPDSEINSMKGSSLKGDLHINAAQMNDVKASPPIIPEKGNPKYGYNQSSKPAFQASGHTYDPYRMSLNADDLDYNHSHLQVTTPKHVRLTEVLANSDKHTAPTDYDNNFQALPDYEQNCKSGPYTRLVTDGEGGNRRHLVTTKPHFYEVGDGSSATHSNDLIRYSDTNTSNDNNSDTDVIDNDAHSISLSKSYEDCTLKEDSDKLSTTEEICNRGTPDKPDSVDDTRIGNNDDLYSMSLSVNDMNNVHSNSAYNGKSVQLENADAVSNSSVDV